MDRFDWLELEGPVSSRQGAPSLSQEPRDGPSCYRAARRMRQAGFLGAAAEYYRKAVGLDAHFYAAWVELVDTLLRNRQVAEADAASQEAADNYRQVRPLYAARALVFGHQGKFGEAFPLSDISLEDGERSWYARLVRAELLLRLNADNRSEALAYLEQAAQLAEKAWEPCWLGGWALLQVGLPVLAASFLTEAAHLNPRAVVCWLCLADSFYALRFYEQALFYYQRATELEPNNERGIAGQKRCGSKFFGLMRGFRKPDLQARWKREFDKLFRETESEANE